jgi:hypothetical protein
VQALDEVFVVGRLGRAVNRAPSLALGSIRGVVTGAHGCYVLDEQVSAGSTGCLAFAADGTPLGICVTKRAADAQGQPGMGPGMGRGGRGDSTIVVRTVADILELASKAKGGAKPEKKTEAPEKKTAAPAPAPKNATTKPEKPATKPAPDSKSEPF